MKRIYLLFMLCLSYVITYAQQEVPQNVMENIYQEIRTPHKYGLVLLPPDPSDMMDSPTVFREGNMWYMTYIIFDGRGYETYIASSKDLLNWETKGRIMSYDETSWDRNQVAGYPALIDTEWEGDYRFASFDRKYWMSYLGGDAAGYEAGILSVGMANTRRKPSKVHEWNRMDVPVLRIQDEGALWWENTTIYKSSVIWDQEETAGSPFVMFYNAKGDRHPDHVPAERIGIAFSDDMVNWKRYEGNPVLDHGAGITGDAYIQKIGDVWVMFYFGAFWGDYPSGAFNHFACSYDLLNWTDWNGPHLIEPSEDFDSIYAHKSCVVKWDGVVYHFYCAVNGKGQRSIAVATSADLGKSQIAFPEQ